VTSIVGCSLLGKSASAAGGGMVIDDANPTITNCISHDFLLGVNAQAVFGMRITAGGCHFGVHRQADCVNARPQPSAFCRLLVVVMKGS
jgi:hypothetical protein